MPCCCLGRAPRQTHDGPGGVRRPRYGTARPSDPQVKAVPAYAGRATLSGEFPPSGRGVTAYKFALQSGMVLRIAPGMQGCDGGGGELSSPAGPQQGPVYIASSLPASRRGGGRDHDTTGPARRTPRRGKLVRFGLGLEFMLELWYHQRDIPPSPHSHSLTPVSPASAGAGCARHVVTPKSPGPPSSAACLALAAAASVPLRSIQAGTAVGGSCVTSRVPGTHSSLGHTMLRTAVVSSSSPFSCCCCWWWYRSSNSLTLRILPPTITAGAGGGGFGVMVSFGLWGVVDAPSNAAPR